MVCPSKLMRRNNCKCVVLPPHLGLDNVMVRVHSSWCLPSFVAWCYDPGAIYTHWRDISFRGRGVRGFPHDGWIAVTTPSSSKDKFFEKVINPYLPKVMKHPEAIDMHEGCFTSMTCKDQ